MEVRYTLLIVADTQQNKTVMQVDSEAPITQKNFLQQRTITTHLTLGPPIEVGNQKFLIVFLGYIKHYN